MNLQRLATLVVLCGALAAAGCANTIRGVGRDAANTVNATEGAVKNVAGAAE
jgi:Entericidin EcnA/B family.